MKILIILTLVFGIIGSIIFVGLTIYETYKYKKPSLYDFKVRVIESALLGLIMGIFWCFTIPIMICNFILTKLYIFITKNENLS